MVRSTLVALLALIALVPALSPVTAQTERRLTARDLSGMWQGQWVSAAGYLYTTTLTLAALPDGSVEGHFAWVLKRSPRADEQAKLGMGATEFTTGRADFAARTVSLNGTNKDDPNNVIGLDRYRLTVSDDGRVIGGITWNNGNWQGQILLSR
ncbi:MAG: hypothetical protein Q8N31_02220 [Reyranella sp.]|nr:hypothetical protein [Reyranella sp.]